jgi:alpha-tubulin suppressor-like RCC1 family protein
VLADNTIRCWGENFDGQLGNGNFVGFLPPDPSASNTATIVPVSVSGIVSASQVAAGQFHTCALLLNGNIMCWGRNDDGQLGNGTGIFSPTPVQVALP